MRGTPFRILYTGITLWAIIAILIYCFQLLAHRQPFPPVLHTVWLLFVLTFPRLLCLNVFLHRGLAHQAFRATSSLFQYAVIALSSLSLLPYSPQTWALRHLHYHTRHPHIQHVPSDAVSPAVVDGAEKQPDAAETAEHTAARVIVPLEYRPSLWRLMIQLHALWRYEDLWQPVPEDGSQNASTEASAAHYYHIVAPALFNVLAFVVLMSVHSHLHTVMVVYYAASLLAVSQLYLWMASAAMLNHSLAFPLLGYQLYRNPHHNNLLASLLTAGGGFLNNHHAQPSHPYHTSLPYELDPSSLLIRLLSYTRLIKLSSKSTVPPTEPIAFPGTGVLAGRVSHTRMWPFHHRFEYSVSFMRVELTPLTPLALDAYPLYSSRGRRWYLGVGINPRAYLTAEQVLKLCADEGVAKERLTTEAGARVLLVTCPSYLGFTMNPISYYLIYARPTPSSQPTNLDPQLGEFIAMVSEVHNTPWGQRCHYVHAAQREKEAGEFEGWLYDVKDKKMHVSPFMSMHYTYTLHYTLPTLDHWDIRWTMLHTPQPEATQPATVALSNRHPIQPTNGAKTDLEKRHFKAILSLQGASISQWVALQNVVKYPLQSIRVVWGIYWQAAVLFVRKHAVFYSHPDPNTRLF